MKGGQIPPDMFTVMIMVIPEPNNKASSVSNYWSISLLNRDIKILTSILAALLNYL